MVDTVWSRWRSPRGGRARVLHRRARPKRKPPRSTWWRWRRRRPDVPPTSCTCPRSRVLPPSSARAAAASRCGRRPARSTSCWTTQCCDRHGPLAVIAPPLRHAGRPVGAGRPRCDRRGQFDRQRSRELQSPPQRTRQDNIFACSLRHAGCTDPVAVAVHLGDRPRRAAAGAGAGDVGDAGAAVRPRASQGHAAAGRGRRHHPRRSARVANRRRREGLSPNVCPSPLAGGPSRDGRRSRSRAAQIVWRDGRAHCRSRARPADRADGAEGRSAISSRLVNGAPDVATITQTLADFATRPSSADELRGAWRSTHSTPWRSRSPAPSRRRACR